jgi:MFS family permease
MQGMGNGAINASCKHPHQSLIISLLLANAIVQGEFPDKVGNIISLQQAFTNLGMLSGPIMGSYLFLWGGFKCPFFVLGITLITLTLITQFSVKKDPPFSVSDGEEETYKLIADANKRSGFFYLLKHFVNPISFCKFNLLASINVCIMRGHGYGLSHLQAASALPEAE